MNELRQSETVTIKACCGCSGGLLERDRFCRWCGVPQTGAFPQSEETTSDRAETSVYSNSISPYTTSPLGQTGNQSKAFRPVSGPLVQAMIKGMSTTTGAPLYSRALRSVVQVLVSVPIWLMIVLLSPFDAYAAAKSISKHFTPETASQSVCEQQPIEV